MSFNPEWQSDFVFVFFFFFFLTPYSFGTKYEFSWFETDLLQITFHDYYRYADMRMIIGLKISEMWHLLGESLAYIFRFTCGQWCNDCLVRSVVQNRIWIPLPLLLGEKGWRSGERALLPPIWPGLLVLSLAPRGFSPGTPVFPSPQKPTLANSNSIWDARTRLNEFLRTPK